LNVQQSKNQVVLGLGFLDDLVALGFQVLDEILDSRGSEIEYPNESQASLDGYDAFESEFVVSLTHEVDPP
jgi:hypothetical protein